MIKGKTKSGFEFEIPEKAFNDYELLEMMGDFNEDKSIFPKIARRMLGVEQHNRLKEHLRDEDGYVPADKIEVELTEIFTFAPGGPNALKN